MKSIKMGPLIVFEAVLNPKFVNCHLGINLKSLSGIEFGLLKSLKDHL